MTSRRAAAVAALLGFAVLIGGCKSAEEEFRDELEPVRVELAAQKTEIAELLDRAKLGRARDARAIAAAASELGATADRMSRMDAPDSVADEFGRFVEANVGLVASLQAYAKALAAGSELSVRRRAEQSQLAAGQIVHTEGNLDDALAG